MIFVLLLTAWCLRFLKRTLASVTSADAGRRDYLVAGMLAYGGVLSEWVALFACAVVCLAFAVVAATLRVKRSPRAARVLFVAVSVACGSGAAVLTMAVLYGTKVGFAFFVRQFMSRVDERTGAGAFTVMAYIGVLVKQLETSWPAAMMVLLSVMAIAVVVHALAVLARGRGRLAERRDAPLLLLAVVLGFGPPVAYCYRLQDLIAIHWWFSGTWAVAWMITVCAFIYVGRSWIARMRRPAAKAIDMAFCAAILAFAIGWNLQFADLAAKEGALAEGSVLTPGINAAHEIYRAVGRALPRDGAPLVVADMPHLFGRYPFTTAYVLRPVVRMNTAGTLTTLGTTEDALPAIAAHGGDVYVAYDRSLHTCGHADATPEAWRASTPLALCRVPVTALTDPSNGVFADTPDQNVVFARWLATDVVEQTCCDAPRLLDVTRVVDSRLRLRSAEAIAAARASVPDPLATLIGKWQQRFGGSVQVVDPRFADTFVVGIASDADRWYLLVVNGGANPLPDYANGVTVAANGTRLDVIVPYQVNTTAGGARLPFSLLVVRAPTTLPPEALKIELLQRGQPLTRTTNVFVAERKDEHAMRKAERDALTSLSTGCTGPPGPPAELQTLPAASGGVRLSWSGAPGGPEAYVPHGGTSPGAVDVTQGDLGDTATKFEARRVPPGTYYLRVRGRNACGLGAASNEVAAVVR